MPREQWERDGLVGLFGDGGHGGAQRWRILWDALLGLTWLWFQV